jgi:hypothetical protein
MCLVAGCIDDCDIRGVMIGADGKIVWVSEICRTFAHFSEAQATSERRGPFANPGLGVGSTITQRDHHVDKHPCSRRRNGHSDIAITSVKDSCPHPSSHSTQLGACQKEET